MKFPNSSRNQNGFGLMEIMISVAIMGVVIAGMVTFLENSNRGTLNLQQKLEIVQISQDITRDLSDPQICACNLNSTINTANAGALRFDSTDPQSFIELPQVFSTCVSGVPGNPLFTAGQPVPGSQSRLAVDKIRVRNFTATGTGRFRAAVEVSFAGDSLIMGRRPATVNVNLVANLAAPTQARIVSCAAGPGSGGGGFTCPATTIVQSGITYSPPEAPLGAYYVATAPFPPNPVSLPPSPGFILDFGDPGCGVRHLRCTYVSQSPPTPGWVYRVGPACPPDPGPNDSGSP